MRAFLVVAGDPGIEIGLQLLDRAVDLAPEGDAVELVQHRPVEALDDAVGLRAFGFGAAVVDVLDGEIELDEVDEPRKAVWGGRGDGR